MSEPPESVWDYPRPPRAERSAETVEIEVAGRVVARTNRSVRVLETSHPPTYYVPMADFADGVLQPGRGSSWCEWKGRASYHDLVAGGERARAAGWSYPDPDPAFAIVRDAVAVYPALRRALHGRR